MRKQERANYISKYLNKLFPNPPIPLDHRDNYTFLIAVLLSAQCTDKRVNLTTPKLFTKASTPEKMMKLPLETIDAIVKPCGLANRKAPAIKELSRILVEEHDGEVPASFEELEALPGVGHKTASVIMNQAFKVPAFPVDTHIHRLAQQWELTDGRSVVQTERDLKKLFPENEWSRLHLQIIMYGREVCAARQCKGLDCPICKHCFPKRKRERNYKKA